MELFKDETDQNKLPFELPSKPGYFYNRDESGRGFNIQIPNGELFYAEHFFDKKISDRSVEYFLENDTHDWRSTDWRSLDKEQLDQVAFKNIQWHHDQIRIYGKSVFIPRYSAWYGDSDKVYSYSGLTLTPKPWNTGLLYIKHAIDQVANVQFNSVLMNWYRDGADYMNWHTDAEMELGRDPVIGSVNFGATRRFQLRRIDDVNEKFEIPLKHGTFLLMKGQLQHFWQHAVPKQLKVRDARFNLTFRIIK